MSRVPPIQGVVAYDFREAVNALAHSSADAATLAARWFDICNTETPKDVTVALSSGESITVPNLAKAIESLKERKGDVDASSVKVSKKGSGSGVDIKTDGVDIGTARANYADGSQKGHHAYATPYNTFHDAYYMTAAASCTDAFDFFNVPRYILFGTDVSGASSLDATGSHKIVIRPLTVGAALTGNRTDKKGMYLCMQFTVVNTDPSRTVTIPIANDAAGESIVLTVTLAPGQHANYLVWCYRGADRCSIIQLA